MLALDRFGWMVLVLESAAGVTLFHRLLHVAVVLSKYAREGLGHQGRLQN
jgi:hypothetical protein